MAADGCRVDVGIQALSRPAFPGQAHRLPDKEGTQVAALIAKDGAVDSCLWVSIEKLAPSE